MEVKNIVTKQINGFTLQYSQIWWNTEKQSVPLVNSTSYWDKRKKEKETDEFIEAFVGCIENFPEKEKERRLWKEKVQGLIEEFTVKSELISKQDKNILLNQGLPKITEQFVSEAKSFNPNMKIEDIGQAMRNVWIMNIIQMLLGKKPEFTEAVFGYSMLYPYTDNYLDHTEISREEKIEISNRFEKRLKGEVVEANNPYEDSLFELVRRIEGQYNRIEYPEVFESLLGIHYGQKKSLFQQGRKSCPYDTDILGISIEKGGISVLADAYLVSGKLTEEEARFFFGYGVLLQICDDLQDAAEDLKNNHMTIVSQIAKKWPLDNITTGLINFTLKLIDSAECFHCENKDQLKELIRKNCIQLILFAIAKNKRLYSRKYFREVEGYFPYRNRYMNGFYKKLKKKYSNIQPSYGGMATEEIIMYAIS